MPFCCGKRSASICVVLGPKKSSTYSSEYASGVFEPAALHLPAASLPRDEGLLGQTPRLTDCIYSLGQRLAEGRHSAQGVLNLPTDQRLN